MNDNKALELNWVNILWLTLTPLAAIVTVSAHVAMGGFHWGFLVLCAVGIMIPNLCITAGYHRLISHLSYTASPIVRAFFLLFGAATFQGSALVWATDHRRHHRQVDTEGDPYNINQGLFYAHMGWMFHKDEARYRNQFPNDLASDKMIAWQHKYYVWVAIATGFAIPTAIGWAAGGLLGAFGGLAWGGFLRVVVGQHITFCINSLCHYFGRQPYNLKNSARDSHLMAILAGGEGYHNFHHKFQSDYRNGFRWFHWDPTKWLIASLAWSGLARNRRKVPDALILQAKMQTEHQRLMNIGITSDRLNVLRTKVEEAQNRMRNLYEEYRRMKRTMQRESRLRVIHMKAEYKVAKLEFKMSCAQWYAYLRAVKAVPAYR